MTCPEMATVARGTTFLAHLVAAPSSTYENTRAQLDLGSQHFYLRIPTISTHLVPRTTRTLSPVCHSTNVHLFTLVFPLLVLHDGHAFCTRWHEEEAFQLYRVGLEGSSEAPLTD
jgi:hypothetical protein